MQFSNTDWRTLRQDLMDGKIPFNPCRNWVQFGHKDTICPLCGQPTELVQVMETENSLPIRSYFCESCDVAFSVDNIQTLGVLFSVSNVVKLGVSDE